MKWIRYYFIVFGFCNYVLAQDVLTLNDAIKISLEKNYSILISKNDVEIAKKQNNIGNAGMSPSVSLNGNIGLANVNSYQEFSNGGNQDRKGAQNTNTGASVNLSWVIFDGLEMFAVKKRLGYNERLNELELKQQMESTVYDIMVSYYNVVRITRLISSAKQNLSIYDERLKLTKLKMEIGSDSKVDLLMTITDENKVKSDILKLEQQLAAAKIELNSLLVRSVDTEFSVPDSIAVNYEPNIDELKKTTLKNNSSILIAQQNQLIGEQYVKETRSVFLPRIQLNSSYNFVLSKSEAGFLVLNRQLGLNAGLNASWLLFNGNKNRRLVQEKEIMLMNYKYLIDQNITQVDALAYLNYKNFLTNKQIVSLEKDNLTSASELIAISLERYKLGKASLLETKETQKIYEDAQVRYINSLYEIKLSEASLLRANGSLIK